MDVSYRAVSSEDLACVELMLRNEGWTVGGEDVRILYQYQAQAFLGCYHDATGALLGVSIVPQIAPTTFFVAFLVTDPQHRGKGYGRALLNKVMKQFESHNIMLISVHTAIGLYARHGFHSNNTHVMKFQGVPDLSEVKPYEHSRQSREITADQLEAVLAYDLKVHSYQRKDFMKLNLESPSKQSRYCVGGNGEVSGFIMFGPCATGARVYALYADDMETARYLLYETLWLYSSSSEKQLTFFCTDSAVGEQLLKPIGCFKEVAEAETLMYTRCDMSEKIDMRKVFFAMNDSAVIA